MPEYVLCRVEELPPAGEAREFEIAGRVLCVANIGGECSALDNVCIHKGGPLGQGMIEGGKVVCPWHGWAFDPKTGAAAHDARAHVRVYPSRIAGENYVVTLD